MDLNGIIGNGSTKSTERRACKCGTNVAFPGRLTCDGQKCACYSVNAPCTNCACRGCRNPWTVDGQKIIRDWLPDLGDQSPGLNQWIRRVNIKPTNTSVNK